MVDAGCVVALTSNVNLEVKYVGNLKWPFFGVSTEMSELDMWNDCIAVEVVSHGTLIADIALLCLNKQFR